MTIFSAENKTERIVPDLPPTEGVDYNRASGWSNGKMGDLLKDPIGTFKRNKNKINIKLQYF